MFNTITILACACMFSGNAAAAFLAHDVSVLLHVPPTRTHFVFEVTPCFHCFAHITRDASIQFFTRDASTAKTNKILALCKTVFPEYIVPVRKNCLHTWNFSAIIFWASVFPRTGGPPPSLYGGSNASPRVVYCVWRGRGVCMIWVLLFSVCVLLFDFIFVGFCLRLFIPRLSFYFFTS